MRRIAVFVLAILTTIAAYAADTPAAKPSTAQTLALVRAWTDAQRMYDTIPGMSVAIVNDQSIVWSGGFGYADPATKKPAAADTIYSICSVSKLFTSVGVMQLRDAGKLRLDDPVSKHLPWFTLKPPAGSGEFTIFGILTHSSGLPREADYPYWSGTFDFPTHEQIVARASAQPAIYPAETYFQYSNFGLTLAGEIVAAASGQPFDTYIHQRILDPLGMTSTTTDMPANERGKRLAQGFSAVRRDGTRAPVPFYQARGVAPAAGFASTVDDLGRFAEWQFRDLSTNGNEVLDARTLREMQRANWVDPDLKGFRGLGFRVWKVDDKVFVGHEGVCPGYRTAFTMRPAEKVAIVVMANALGAEVGEYAKAIYDMVSAADGKAATSDADAALAPYVGSYDAFPWGGETLFAAWGDELLAMDIPNRDPMAEPDHLRKVGDNTFQRVRKDGALGEKVVFEMGPDGKAKSVTWHSNPSPRIK
jgi:CubicO group peptidase (beta-lactamase class C family)